MEIPTVATPTHEYTHRFFFRSKPFEIEKFLRRKKLCSKKKEHKQGQGRSTVNAEVFSNTLLALYSMLLTNKLIYLYKS